MAKKDSRLLPQRPIIDGTEPSAVVVSLTSDRGDAVFDALGSRTARRIFESITDDPATPPELADRLDLSLQTVHYHLRPLEHTNLITEVDTAYSEKGVEMSIYGTTADPIVFSSRSNDVTSRIQQKLPKILGVICLLGVIGGSYYWAYRTVVSSEPPPFPRGSGPARSPNATTHTHTPDPQPTGITTTTTPIPTNETVSKTTERVLDGTHSVVPTPSPSPHTASIFPALPAELLVLFGLFSVLCVLVRHHRTL